LSINQATNYTQFPTNVTKNTQTYTHTELAGHLTQMGKTSKAYKNLAGQQEGRHQSG